MDDLSEEYLKYNVIEICSPKFSFEKTTCFWSSFVVVVLLSGLCRTFAIILGALSCGKRGGTLEQRCEHCSLQSSSSSFCSFGGSFSKLACPRSFGTSPCPARALLRRCTPGSAWPRGSLRKSCCDQRERGRRAWKIRTWEVLPQLSSFRGILRGWQRSAHLRRRSRAGGPPNWRVRYGAEFWSSSERIRHG